MNPLTEDLFMLDLRGSDSAPPQELLAAGSFAARATILDWVPTPLGRSRLVIQAPSGEGASLRIIDVRETLVDLVTIEVPLGRSVTAAKMSPDGAKIIYGTDRYASEESMMYIAAAPEWKPRELGSIPHGLIDLPCSFSNDSRHAVCSLPVTEPGSLRCHVSAITFDGGALVATEIERTDGARCDLTSFSPDSRMLVYHRSNVSPAPGVVSKIIVVPVDDNGPKVEQSFIIRDGASSASFLAWRPELSQGDRE